MRPLSTVFASLVSAAASLGFQPPPAETSPFQIQVERSENCSIVTVRRADGSAAFELDDGCHGWSAEHCNGMLFLRRIGIVEDGGTVIRPTGAKHIDVPTAINDALHGKSPPREYLHLQFRKIGCSSAGMELPFAGSSLRLGASGSAEELHGVMRVSRNGRYSVRLGIG